ncbi:MAG TPA: hypothetical protein VFJ72_14630 [Rubrobacteraceae bacterium]|nr:hypothetical protein [Rubrobacteraceae bacterium]
MNLDELFGGSFVDWEAVATSWSKRSMPSRLLLFAARRYLAEADAPLVPARAQVVEPTPLPDEIKDAFAAPPGPEDPAAARWGEFVDAAVVAELEMISYGERPLVLHELRAGLGQAADEAGARTPLGRWFQARHDALPGTDLPDTPEYLPV